MKWTPKKPCSSNTNLTYCKIFRPLVAASSTVPVKLVRLLRSFPLQKKFPAPVKATMDVFGSSAASFKRQTNPWYIVVVIAFFLSALFILMILNFPSKVTSKPGSWWSWLAFAGVDSLFFPSSVTVTSLFPTSSSTKLTYSCWASAWGVYGWNNNIMVGHFLCKLLCTCVISPREFHASHLALPTKLVIPGRLEFTFPVVACLNRPYNLSFTSLLGLSFSVCNLSWAFWKSFARDEYLNMRVPSVISGQKIPDVIWWHLNDKHYSMTQKRGAKKYLPQLVTRRRIGRIMLTLIFLRYQGCVRLSIKIQMYSVFRLQHRRLLQHWTRVA